MHSLANEVKKEFLCHFECKPKYRIVYKVSKWKETFLVCEKCYEKRAFSEPNCIVSMEEL